MDKQESVSKEIMDEARRIIERQLGRVYILSYSHNGGNVFIGCNTSGSGKQYQSQAVICVMKNDPETPLVFRVVEDCNDSMTVFTRAGVDGMPTKSSRDSKIGLYPYGIFPSDDKKTPDTDIMAHAAYIFKNYDEENPGQVQIGKLFRKYVPASYREIKQQLEDMDKREKEGVLKNNKVAQMMKFNESLRGF